MTIREAQEEMRRVYIPSLRPGEFALGGWVGGAMLVLLGVVLLLARRTRLRHSP